MLHSNGDFIYVISSCLLSARARARARAARMPPKCVSVPRTWVQPVAEQLMGEQGISTSKATKLAREMILASKDECTTEAEWKQMWFGQPDDEPGPRPRAKRTKTDDPEKAKAHMETMRQAKRFKRMDAYREEHAPKTVKLDANDGGPSTSTLSSPTLGDFPTGSSGSQESQCSPGLQVKLTSMFPKTSCSFTQSALLKPQASELIAPVRPSSQSNSMLVALRESIRERLHQPQSNQPSTAAGPESFAACVPTVAAPESVAADVSEESLEDALSSVMDKSCQA